MQQYFTWPILAIFICISAFACVQGDSCPALSGRWTNREGQEFIFQPGGKALWLLQFGSRYDTARCNYRVDCSRQPARIDFDHFDMGPHAGKTLQGIIEWSSDSSFRLRYEAGTEPDTRPTAFDQDQTIKFFIVR